MIQNDLLAQSAKILRRLNEAGFDCVAEDDFDTIPDKVQAFGKPFQSPPFANLRNDFTRGAAFWSFLTRDGERVGGLAAQYRDLRDEKLDAYLTRTARGQYGGGQRAVDWVAEPVGEMIGGRVVYFGELYFSDKARGSRVVLSAFARLSMILAAMSWPDYDWMYAFVPREQARFADYYGFTYRLPAAMKWTQPAPRGRGDSHMLLAIAAADFKHILATGELSEF
ncbi:hypothetical protein U5922_016655 [Aquicoccus sp. G2-2]|uniref:hypothetical protein n=1 Tax=Aquicoccus sp. G2-2 TaxID=3092120 RepID=UPI00366E57A2